MPSTQVQLCRHFGVCGGCSSQDVPYEDQLSAKEERVRKILEPFSPGEFRPILPSPDIFYYRNKMEFAFAAAEDGGPVLGLRQKGRFDRIENLRECLLLSTDTQALLEAVRRWAAHEKLAPYDLKKHRGFLRYLAVREGKNTGQRMLHLVTAEGPLPHESLLDALTKSGIALTTLVWSVNAGLSDLARGESTRVLHGPGKISETLGGLTFEISPNAFFQTNTRGAEILYKNVSEFLGPGAEILVDLYCGGGAIGLYCARKFQELIGVEIHAPSIEDAAANARAQGMERSRFLALDAAEFPKHPRFKEWWSRDRSAAVVDPPRPGVAKSLRRLLLEFPLKRWVYVSCNPAALAQDLPYFKTVYDIEKVQAVDLFPHTPHVETVLSLVQKPASSR